MNPQISIIIPMYNAEKYIKECIESILRQEYTDFEVIIVNDGSTDNSGLIVKSIAGDDRRLHYLEQQNTGVCGARNAGLDAASGELIFFMDADDWLEPDSLDVLYSEYQRTNSDMIVGDIRFVGDLRIRNLYVFDKSFTTTDKEWIDKYEMACIGYGYNPNPGTKYNITGLGSMGNKLYKRDIIEKKKLRFDPYTLGIYEDNLFVLHYLVNCQSVTYVSKIIQDGCFYKIIRYRQFGVRDEQREVLGDYTTDEEYALRYVELARSLGAAKAYLV